MTVLTQILAVFTAVSEWIVTNIPNFFELFWNAEGSTLTILGALAVAGLAISVAFLLMGLIQRFIKFRG